MLISNINNYTKTHSFYFEIFLIIFFETKLEIQKAKLGFSDVKYQSILELTFLTMKLIRQS